MIGNSLYNQFWILSSYTANRKWETKYSIIVDVEFWLSVVNPLSGNCTTIISNSKQYK